MNSQPTGTLTFLFTDIEGSTERWQRDDDAMSIALATHDQLLREVVERHGGTVFKHTGDGMCAVFRSAVEAVAAAVEAQSGLALPVRVGLHTGEAQMRDGDYFGPTLNRAARVMDAGHGGQVLASAATAGLIDDHELVDLGEHDLKGLDTAERIFQVGRGAFPALRSRRSIVGNLPVELSTFIGRSHEVDSLVTALADHRLITLIGVGGTGKTRLAVETGLAVSGSFPDGCWMVGLAAVGVPEAVPFAIAAGVGVTAPPDGDVIEHVIARLRHRRLLIVVDNCEHLLSAAADAVERIVSGCTDVAVLATSREPLMVRGERLVPVPSLSTEDAERLFLERARDEAPGLVIDAEQARAVTELCQRLDGLPLALELAASRVRAMTPVELVGNLEERFRLLVGGRRSRMERHQTMRGTLDWSYDLCSVAERAVFDRLSVFPAGFDLAAARAVGAGDELDELAVVDTVSQLVDRSLLQRATAVDGTTRYRMLETMRAYGREHLQHDSTADTIRALHAGYMAHAIGALSLRTVGPDEREVAQRLNEYLPDALVALDWFIEHGDWENGLRVSLVGTYLSERESGEMATRLHTAASAGGLTGDLLDEVARGDNKSDMMKTSKQLAERGWRAIRGQAPIPNDRYATPPHGDFGASSLTNGDVSEFLASLERWGSAPPLNRYVAERHAIRAVAYNGFLDHLEQPMRRFTTFVADLDSTLASRELAELHAVIAQVRHDWPDAVHWYAKAAASDGQLRTWFDLSVAWDLLMARALCDEPFDPTGAELRDPWHCYRNEHIEVLGWRGATSTAVTLHRLGRTDLADRFVAWAYSRDTADVMPSLFGDVLALAGLSRTAIDQPDELATLLDELFAVADEIDRRAPSHASVSRDSEPPTRPS